MIEQVFRSARAMRRLRSCLLAPVFEDLVEYLADRGYSTLTIRTSSPSHVLITPASGRGDADDAYSAVAS